MQRKRAQTAGMTMTHRILDQRSAGVVGHVPSTCQA